MQATTQYSSTGKPIAMAPAGDRQVLLFNVGTRIVGVPLDHVRYVANMPSDFVYCGAEAAGHFVFDGNPLVYVSLWDALGLKSANAELEEMQVMLPLRRQDHIEWIGALEHSIETGTAFAKARSPHECAFGKWYFAFQADDLGLSLLLKQFAQPHAQIHALADKLLGMAESGKIQAALCALEEAKKTTLSSLLETFDETQAFVRERQRRILLIMMNGDSACALGADGVRNIVSVPAERIKPNLGKSMGVESSVISSLIILDDETVAPLLNLDVYCGGG